MSACPFCSSVDTRPIDTPAVDGDWRRCENCGAPFRADREAQVFVGRAMAGGQVVPVAPYGCSLPGTWLDTTETNLAAGDWPRDLPTARQVCVALMRELRLTQNRLRALRREGRETC